MMWSVVLPPANNPFMDDHIVYALVLILLAADRRRPVPRPRRDVGAPRDRAALPLPEVTASCGSARRVPRGPRRPGAVDPSPPVPRIPPHLSRNPAQHGGLHDRHGVPGAQPLDDVPPAGRRPRAGRPPGPVDPQQPALAAAGRGRGRRVQRARPLRGHLPWSSRHRPFRARPAHLVRRRAPQRRGRVGPPRPRPGPHPAPGRSRRPLPCDTSGGSRADAVRGDRGPVPGDLRTPHAPPHLHGLLLARRPAAPVHLRRGAVRRSPRRPRPGQAWAVRAARLVSGAATGPGRRQATRAPGVEPGRPRK